MNVSKHLLFASMLLSASSLALTSCEDDNDWADVDGNAPTLNLTVDAVHVEPGMSITIKGKVADADGISTIALVCPELYLDKTIDLMDIYADSIALNGPIKEYDLDYSFQTARHEDGENFKVKVTVTDIGGRQDVKEFGANLDADFTAPYFTAVPAEEITVLIKNETAIKLNVEVSDNIAVDYLSINLVDAGGKSVEGFPIRLEGGEKVLAYTKPVVVPSVAASYKLTVEAADKGLGDEPHVITATSTINVMDLPNLDVIYLADVATAAELNADAFGVPIAMNHVGDYKYRVIYYNEKAGTEVCFIGQKTDFGPLCFAPSKENPTELGDDPDEVDKIKLDRAETYYEFFVDTWNRTYSYKTYAPSAATNPMKHVRYGQDDLNTWWDHNVPDPWWQEFYFGPSTGPGSVKRMEQDAKNPNIYYCYDINPSDFADGDNMKFIVHNWHSHGWWNFASWRSETSVEPSKFVYYGNFFPDATYCGHYESNMDYFQWKYIDMDAAEYAYQYPNAGAFDISKWGDEGYRKNFIGDNWVNTPMPAAGKYTFKIDLHAERGWMYLQK